MLDRIKNENIRELAADKLFALQNTMRLDGRVSSYPANVTGYSVSNCYLLKQPDAAWLIDTGFGGHEAALRAQIESLIARNLPLSLLPLRLNEFMSIQNIDPFTLYFNVKECFASNPDAASWFDFGAGSDSGQDTLHRLKITTPRRGEVAPIGNLGRPVIIYQAPIRLIATLTAAAMCQLTGMRLVHVPYRGAAPAVNDAIAGHVDLVISGSSLTPHIESGQVRPIVQFGERRAAFLANTATAIETGTNLRSDSWFGFFGPAGTPKPMIDRFYGDVVAAVREQANYDAMVNRFRVEVPLPTPDELRAMIVEGLPFWAKIVRDNGIKGE